MKLHHSVAALLLPALCLAAKKGSASTFAKWHSKSLVSVPITLDDSTFSELTAAPRDYGALVCLTAVEARFGCKICQDLKPEYEILATSWIKGEKNAASRTLFGNLDFLDGRQTFQSLNLDTAPILMYYPPTTGPNASPSSSPIRYDFTTNNPSAEQLHAWLVKTLPADVPKPELRRPINWVRIATVTTLVLGAITGIIVAWPFISFVIQSRNLWASMSVIAVLLFTSGHMFNHIRGAPYVAGNGKGGVQYITPGFQNQLGIESQIVAALYGILAFATTHLALKVPRIQDPKKQQAAVFIWCAVTYGFYSILMSIFRKKNGGYPYILPPF